MEKVYRAPPLCTYFSITESRFCFPNHNLNRHNLLIGDSGMLRVSILVKSYAEIPALELHAQPCTDTVLIRPSPRALWGVTLFHHLFAASTADVMRDEECDGFGASAVDPNRDPSSVSSLKPTLK